MAQFQSRDENERWKAERGREVAVTVTKVDLQRAAAAGLIPEARVEPLWSALLARHLEAEETASAPAAPDVGQSTARSRFDLLHLAYYFGALLVISAMGWFMTLGWELLGGMGIFLTATVYATVFTLAARRLWFQERLRVPGGLLVTLAVWMVPLAIYGLERLTGLWPQGDPGAYRGYHVWVKGSWFIMEVGTILAGLAALRFFRFPFLTFPIAFTLWYMSMDLTPLLFGKTDFNWNERLWVSLFFGLAMLLAAYAIDRRTREDYAFWGYLFGLAAFWAGLSLMESGSELGRFLYCLVNVGLMIISVLLERRTFLVFGAFGVFGYLGYLSYRVFTNSLVFPFVVTFIGLAIIYLGVLYQRHRTAIERAVRALVPGAIRQALPPTRTPR